MCVCGCVRLCVLFLGGLCALKGMFCRRFTFVFTFALAFISIELQRRAPPAVGYGIRSTGWLELLRKASPCWPVCLVVSEMFLT